MPVLPNVLIFFLCLCWPGVSLSFSEPGWKSQRLNESLLRGRLTLAADSTLSKEKGKVIFAQGNVFLKYEMEQGETLEAGAQFLQYEESTGKGELWGAPSALWSHKVDSRKNRNESQQTRLEAEKIIFRLKESELTASGAVKIFQGSSTLTAGEAHFFDSEKKLSARGNRPTFTLQDGKHTIKISAEEIDSFVEQKNIQFQKRVQGKIEFIK